MSGRRMTRSPTPAVKMGAKATSAFRCVKWRPPGAVVVAAGAWHVKVRGSDEEGMGVPHEAREFRTEDGGSRDSAEPASGDEVPVPAGGCDEDRETRELPCDEKQVCGASSISRGTEGKTAETRGRHAARWL